MKASEHLWILMLVPVSLSEVLARVCLKTWNISTILLPGGAVWVFLAILTLFMAPSTRTDRDNQRNRLNIFTFLSPFTHQLKSTAWNSFLKMLRYLVEPRLVSCLSAGRLSSRTGWVWGSAADRTVACAGGRSGSVWSSQLVSEVNLWSTVCGQAEQLYRG